MHHEVYHNPNSSQQLNHSLKNHYSQTWWRAFQNELELLSNNQFISKHAAFFNI